jgi:hypothetical protein
VEHESDEPHDMVPIGNLFNDTVFVYDLGHLKENSTLCLLLPEIFFWKHLGGL